ncbi:MAG: hypothetical protein K0R14_1807 [Burkholderiales bacterium]|jgi:hypothetical protein|nr:hypothetical protein [Burkholderiales bacterium]
MAKKPISFYNRKDFGELQMKKATNNLYEKDFYKWAHEQAHYIKTRAFNKLDIEHLFDEVEDMSRSEERELESRLARLLQHLLKWKYQSGNISSGWRGTIEEQRYRIQRRLQQMPSLKNKIKEILLDSYHVAKIQASADTGISSKVFPELCEWTLTQILKNDFYPNYDQK